MLKNALLPIKFYPANGMQDYEKISGYSGDPGISYLKEHYLYYPAFQLTMPDIGRHWGIFDLTTIEIINYDTGDTVDLLSLVPVQHIFKYPEVYNKAGDFRSLVHYRFPRNKFSPDPLSEGRHYYHVSDGETEWFSEIFEICDLELNALLAAFANDVNFDAFSSSIAVYPEDMQAIFCKVTTGAGDAEAYTEFEVMLEEELDLYVFTENGAAGGPCAAIAQWNAPVYLELRDATGLVVSDTFTVDTNDTDYTFTLKSFVGGTVRLYMYILDADQTKGAIDVWLQRRYVADHVQIRYSHPENFCKIWYENDYENVFFLDAKQVIDQQVIDENVVEDDQANKYRTIGTNQKWNSVQFASGEAMLNAMSLMRLHNNIKIIRETGEINDVVELLLEQSILKYEASLIKLVYREDSCSVESCGFEPCCPTLGTPIMETVYGAVGALPPAGAGNNGDYVMVLTAVADQYLIYLSNGAAWNIDNTYDVADNCVEARIGRELAAFNYGMRFFWFDTGGAVNRWRIFIELASVADATGGIATLTTDTEYRDGLTIRGEYYDTTDEEWKECTDPVDLTAGGGAEVLSCKCGAGANINFRLHAYTDDCDYGYTNIVTQTIT